MSKRIKRLAWSEAIVNVLSGLILSVFIVQPVVFSLYDIRLPVQDNIGIAVIFTVVSILRGYIWRRWFHKRFYE